MLLFFIFASLLEIPYANNFSYLKINPRSVANLPLVFSGNTSERGFNFMEQYNKESIDILKSKRFGRLTILEDVGRDKNGRNVLALCNCGIIKTYRLGHIKSGKILSCGCYGREAASKSSTTHGLSKHSLYKVYKGMKNRCYNANIDSYKNYGARGIIICDEWLSSFELFFNWSMSNGYKKGLQIDRENNNGNYEPSNCRWVKQKINARNTRTNVFIKYNGKTKTIAEWCEIVGISQKRFYSRRKRGWTIEQTLSTPLLTNKKANGNQIQI